MKGIKRLGVSAVVSVVAAVLAFSLTALLIFSFAPLSVVERVEAQIRPTTSTDQSIIATGTNEGLDAWSVSTFYDAGVLTSTYVNGTTDAAPPLADSSGAALFGNYTLDDTSAQLASTAGSTATVNETTTASTAGSSSSTEILGVQINQLTPVAMQMLAIISIGALVLASTRFFGNGRVTQASSLAGAS